MITLKRKHEESSEIVEIEKGISRINFADDIVTVKRLCSGCNFKVKGNVLCGEKCENLFKLKAHIKKFHFNSLEYRLAQIFKQNGILFERNRLIDYESPTRSEHKKAFLDFVITKSNHIFIIECENHQNVCKNPVSLEIARMKQIQLSLNTSTPIVWLRFNSGVFFVDSCRRSKTITNLIREQKLVSLLETFVPIQNTTVIYMYYDCKTVDGKLRPIVLDDKDYDAEFAKFVLDPIVE